MLRSASAMRLGLALWPQGAAWDEVRAMSLLADELGFDSIWSYDHFVALGTEPTVPVFDGWTTITAVAALTANARVGVLVSGATYRNPGILAKMSATLDHVSQGRAVLGLGAGWHEAEHRAFGVGFPGVAERLALLDEACVVIRSLFDDSITTFSGQHCSMADAVLWPKPVQPRLPLLIGGGGERKTLRIVARHADFWNGFGTPAEVARKLSVLEDHCAAVGRDPAGIGVTVNVGVVVRDSTTDVSARLNELGDIAAFPDYAASNQPYGTPDQVAARLCEYADVGVSEIIAVMPGPYDRETIERLATEVRPRVEARLAG